MRRVTTEAEVVVIWGNQVVEETNLLEEIRKNQIRKQKVQGERQRTDMERWWDSLHRWKNLCSKQ